MAALMKASGCQTWGDFKVVEQQAEKLRASEARKVKFDKSFIGAK